MKIYIMQRKKNECCKRNMVERDRARETECEIKRAAESISSLRDGDNFQFVEDE